MVDDALDLTSTEDELGKPAEGADMKLGLVTAPTYFAIQKFPELKEIIKRKCSEEGDLERVIFLPNLEILIFFYRQLQW